MDKAVASKVLLADGVWLATALLHRNYPERTDFSETEIQGSFLREGFPRGTHPNSLPAHISSHCVANRPRSRKRAEPSKLQGGAYRMLYETRSGFRRLFLPGDDVHPDREQQRRLAKSTPRREDIPEQYWPLLDWYMDWRPQVPKALKLERWEDDPLLRLRGSGRHIWADEHADEYVERLRSEAV